MRPLPSRDSLGAATWRLAAGRTAGVFPPVEPADARACKGDVRVDEEDALEAAGQQLRQQGLGRPAEPGVMSEAVCAVGPHGASSATVGDRATVPGTRRPSRAHALMMRVSGTETGWSGADGLWRSLNGPAVLRAVD